VFLKISTTGTPDRPATDLGFLLHKHPEKAQQFSVSSGTAHVFYPEADAERCTVALLLDVDPVALVRGRGARLAQYVNDRPYAASSMLAVALAKVFSTAMKGQCAARPELPAAPLPLRIEVPALPARGGAEVVERLFAPLGWTVAAESVALDERFPAWGDSRYVRLALDGTARLAEALRQLYVLLPVLDAGKHYWMAPDEVDKLLRAGDGWLEDHPEQRLIVGRYLAHRGSLTREAFERLELARLAEADDAEAEELDNAVDDAEEDLGAANGAHWAAAAAALSAAPGEGSGGAPSGAAGAADAGATEAPSRAAQAAGAGHGTEPAGATPGGEQAAAATPAAHTAGAEPGAGPGGATPGAEVTPADADGEAAEPAEPPVPLAVRRREAIAAALRESGAARVLDLGCGSGQLLDTLRKDRAVTELVGVDVSVRALQIARRRLRLDRVPERQRDRIRLLQGSLVYTDSRLAGYDAAVLSEVIEHVDPPRLPALEYAVFGAARPGTVVVTTPNAEYNVRWESLPAGEVRHADHRFEWDRAQFRDWAGTVAARHGYAVAFRPVGPDDPEVGPPTQLALFILTTPKEAAA
jgi:SAM-dependent methyltransferase